MKKGFSFFELMLVVLIIGSTYALLIQNFGFKDPKKEDLNLVNLPVHLKRDFTKTHVSIKCFDECSICKIYNDKDEIKEIKGLFEKDSDPIVYKLINGYYEKIEFANMYEDYKTIAVCFEYHIQKNGSSDELVLEYKDNFLLYDNFANQAKEFGSLDEVSEYRLAKIDELKELR